MNKLWRSTVTWIMWFCEIAGISRVCHQIINHIPRYQQHMNDTNARKDEQVEHMQERQRELTRRIHLLRFHTYGHGHDTPKGDKR